MKRPDEHLIRSQARKDLTEVVPFRERREARRAYLSSRMKEARDAWHEVAQRHEDWIAKWSGQPPWLQELEEELSTGNLNDLKRTYDRAKGELDNISNDRKSELTDDMLDAARSAPLHLFLDEVKKRGSIGLALCPFHQDTKPSLTIFDEVRYHCFVCQSHGDAIDLLMRRDGLRWKQAVKTVLTTMGYVIAV